MAADGSGQHNLFEIPSLSYQIVDSISVAHTYDVLLDDGSLIQIFRGVVRRGAYNLYTPIIGLPVGIGSDERGQKGVMDIDDRTADL
jgi:hypothetical protein